MVWNKILINVVLYEMEVITEITRQVGVKRALRQPSVVGNLRHSNYMYA